VLVGAGQLSPQGGIAAFTTDALGQFRVNMLAASSGTLLATGAAPAPSFTTATLTAGVQAAFNLIVGTGVPASQTLQGTLGFDYPIACDGTLTGAGVLPYPFVQANVLRLNGLGTRCLSAARAELEGRQIVYGPIRMGGLEVTRKVFVPADGRYVRYVEILDNAAEVSFPAGPIAIDVSLASTFVDPLTLVEPAASTGNRYFIAEGGNAGSHVVAGVIGGAGASTAAAVSAQALGGVTHTRYAVTVPEGEARILVHFIVLRAAGDHAGAEAQAQDLANLLDADMLVGLTPAERARIVNFVVP
jgi:hypothetical protein